MQENNCSFRSSVNRPLLDDVKPSACHFDEGPSGDVSMFDVPNRNAGYSCSEKSEQRQRDGSRAEHPGSSA